MLRKKGARLYPEFTEAPGSMICLQAMGFADITIYDFRGYEGFRQGSRKPWNQTYVTKSDSGFITLGKTLNCMLNESRKNRHPCLISDFGSKAISFSLFNIVVVVVVTLFFCMLWSLCYFEICYFFFFFFWDMLLLIRNFFSTFIRRTVNSAKALIWIYGKDSVISVI